MVYIIAGATGVVGSAISKELAKENEVHLIGRDEEKLSSLSKEIDAQYSLIDLTKTIEQREFSKIIPDDKEIKGLVNCIGSILIKPLHGTKTEEFEEVLRVNLFSSYYLLSSFARRMKNGSAIFFSSVAGTKGLSNHEAIAAANMSQRLLATEQARELSKSMYPIQKIGDFNDILPVVKWLLSEDSKWVTGQTIHVDGGLSTVKPR